MWRLRFDSAWDDNRPTRAEFFYARGGIPGSHGPPRLETKIDFQEYQSYLEWTLAPRLSGFIEGGLRSLNPVVNTNETGIGDTNLGFKWAFLTEENTLATFQMRTYVPTGNVRLGLGTGHVSLEPALLFAHRLLDVATIEGEVRYWLPVGGTNFAGDVVRYGLGVSFGQRGEEGFWLTPVVECVGWTVLGGKELAVTPQAFAVQGAAGDTIVNVKCGVRMGLDNLGDLYVGYGRALTGSVWYKDVLRVELRLLF